MKVLAYLTLLGCCCACTVFAGEKSDVAKRYKDVSVDEFARLSAVKGNVILDVRTTKEFQAGHLPRAVNIDWNGTDFAQKVGALDKSKTYLVHCAVGGRSAKACDKMSQLGFTNLYNLQGGIKEWQKAGKAVER